MRRHRSWTVISLFVLVGFTLPTDLHARRTLFMVNGGGEPTINHCIFVKELVRMASVLPKDDLVILNTGGLSKNASDADLPVCDDKLRELRDTTGNFIYRNTTTQDLPQIDGGANLKNIERHIKKAVSQKDRPDEIVFFFNSHGGWGGPEQTNTEKKLRSYTDTSLWIDSDNLSVNHYRKMIQLVPESTRVVAIHNHCYSGAMLHAFFDKDFRPLKNRCGFSAASQDETSFEGYYIPPFLAAVEEGRSTTFAEAHTAALRKSPISLPYATSDIYLEHYYKTRVSKTKGSQEGMIEWPAGTEFLPLKYKLAALQADANSLLQSPKLKSLFSDVPSRTEIERNYEEKLALVNQSVSAYEQAKGYFGNAVTAYKKYYIKTQPEFIELRKKILAAAKKQETFEKGSKAYRHWVQRESNLRDQWDQKKEWVTYFLGPLDREHLGFVEFVKEYHPNAKKTGWSEQVIQEREAAMLAYRDSHKMFLTLRKLHRNIVNRDAILTLVKNDDRSAMRELLSILECENGLIHPDAFDDPKLDRVTR